MTLAPTFQPGEAAAVHSVRDAYPLPAGLPEGAEVRILQFDEACRVVSWSGREWRVSMMNLGPLAQHFDREKMKISLDQLARRQVYLGTSSWKYEGWLGQLYTPARYQYHGKVAVKRFERDCLAEYASVFKTVCVDAAYYTFPTERYLQGLVDQVSDDFRFTFKVTDEITVKNFPNLPRFGLRAGKPNENFLNAGLFHSAFLRPAEPFKSKIGVLIFEFSKFYSRDFTRGLEFVAALDQFFSQLPTDWPYAVEMRNRKFLQPEYLEVLRKHRVAHVFNSWADMPAVHEQLAVPGSRTEPTLCAARLLLRPGRKYQDAVDQFKPYDRLRDPYPEARAAAATLIKETAPDAPRGTFIYVNNRLEGNALETIASIVELLG